jgi:dolichol kinase
MRDNILNTVILGGLFLVLFAFAELLYHKFKFKAEHTRKIVHLGTGLFTLLFPIWITSHWFILGLCSSFLIILLFSLKYNLLPSINGVDRKTRGSILFPIIVYGCFLVQSHCGSLIYFYIPILILAICDPIAALVGKKFQIGKYTIFGHTKTFIGSAAFCVSAFVVTALSMSSILTIPFGEIILISLVNAILTTISEAISHKGYDNFTIPVTSILVLILFLN